MSSETAVFSDHLQSGESVRCAFSAWVRAGLARRVLGVTDRRVIMVRSAYWRLSDKGLLWADPIDQVALHGTYGVLLLNGLNTGNAYVRLRRADGTTVTFNPRSSFVGNTESAVRNVERLFDLVPGRL
ncbi:hypothetical protein O1R50_19390 [Glycomyces luteolus]|uniref:Uncharacterized protein n=1 Tax=Glycomyces luteolus TaxID=2670330 RepID=A0A9X3PCS3_9ACTN|nr:hypothetical protein [Glycomyces luteolus]MDA1361801.1 hypothetical protein [Glycomyces luteolus]